MTDDSFSEQAYRALEHAIVTLALAPGALVTEKELIGIAGQSHPLGRTPVREAIQKLAWQGLIEIRPRVGLRIAEIAPEHRDLVMAVRAALEPLVAASVAEAASPAARDRLAACAGAMTQAAVTGDIAAFLEADKVFDEILDGACPNPFLVAALAPLRSHARRLWFSGATAAGMDRSVTLHVGVIRAIRGADAQAARQAMAELVAGLGAA